MTIKNGVWQDDSFIVYKLSIGLDPALFGFLISECKVCDLAIVFLTPIYCNPYYIDIGEHIGEATKKECDLLNKLIA